MSENPYQHIVDAVSSPDLVDLPGSPLSVEAIFKQFKNRIAAFEKTLNDDCEVAAMLPDIGESKYIQINTVGFQEPSLILITGTLDGKRCEYIQHVNQFRILLIATPTASPDAKPHRIGYV